MNKINKESKLAAWLVLLLAIIVSCKDYLPTDRDTFDLDARFTQTIYKPVLGRTTLMTDNFNASNSSLPLTFKIVNLRRRSGEPAPELLKPFPVQVWTQRYTGTEQSLEEIEAKRAWENHPLFEIREHSGEFIMWGTAKANIVNAQPDSGYVFDVEVTNNGGRRYYEDLKLIPFRERPYQPTNQDPVTGMNTNPAVHPVLVENVAGEESARLSTADINIYFNRKGDGNSLTFRLLDTALNPINPDKFDLTDWSKLVHGFNMEKTDEYVKYEVAYPIPLVPIATDYTTNDGNEAHIELTYDRLGFGGVRQVGSILFNFSIFQPGDWEIVFRFNNENPKFEDD